MPRTPAIALLAALIPYLVAERSVSVADAAEHFDVDEQRIRDAVDMIFMSGVPDGFGDFDRFDLNVDALEEHDVIELSHLPALEGNTVRLAPREVSAILAGLTLLAGVAGTDDGAIARVSKRLRQAAVPAATTIAVDEQPANADARRIRDAIEHRIVIEIDYRKQGESTTTRRVAPTALELRDGVVSLTGYDLDRAAMRQFRLDRTEAIRFTELPFPEAALVAPRERIASDERILVSATPAAAALLADYASGQPRSDGDRELVEIQPWNVDAVLRRIASLGGEAVIIEPESARAAMRALATDALAAYEADPTE